MQTLADNPQARPREHTPATCNPEPKTHGAQTGLQTRNPQPNTLAGNPNPAPKPQTQTEPGPWEASSATPPHAPSQWQPPARSAGSRTLPNGQGHHTSLRAARHLRTRMRHAVARTWSRRACASVAGSGVGASGQHAETQTTRAKRQCHATNGVPRPAPSCSPYRKAPGGKISASTDDIWILDTQQSISSPKSP